MGTKNMNIVPTGLDATMIYALVVDLEQHSYSMARKLQIRDLNYFFPIYWISIFLNYTWRQWKNSLSIRKVMAYELESTLPNYPLKYHPLQRACWFFHHSNIQVLYYHFYLYSEFLRSFLLTKSIEQDRSDPLQFYGEL